MEENMFFVCARHGQGGLLSGPNIKSSHGTREEAEKASREYRATHPECNGWNARVEVWTREELDEYRYN